MRSQGLFGAAWRPRPAGPGPPCVPLGWRHTFAGTPLRAEEEGSPWAATADVGPGQGCGSEDSSAGQDTGLLSPEARVRPRPEFREDAERLSRWRASRAQGQDVPKVPSRARADPGLPRPRQTGLPAPRKAAGHLWVQRGLSPCTPLGLRNGRRVTKKNRPLKPCGAAARARRPAPPRGGRPVRTVEGARAHTGRGGQRSPAQKRQAASRGHRTAGVHPHRRLLPNVVQQPELRLFQPFQVAARPASRTQSD